MAEVVARLTLGAANGQTIEIPRRRRHFKSDIGYAASPID